jgi:hypothetical protein
MKKTKMTATLALVLGLVFCWIRTSEGRRPVGSEFTYHGRLARSGGPANGPHDFQCKLFDDPCEIVDANQVGATLDINDLDVHGGQFHLDLDFGNDPNIFNGEMRWLEIAVRQGDSNDPCDFTVLEPRVKLNAAPYAVNAGRISGRKVVKTEHLNDRAVDPNKIAQRAVKKEHIENRAVGREKIEDRAVDPNKIERKAVKREHIEDRAVGRNKIEDGAVDPNKIDHKAVRKEHIEDRAVGRNKIEDGAVDANKLGDIAGYSLNTSYNGRVLLLTNADAGNSLPILELVNDGPGSCVHGENTYVGIGGYGVYGRHNAGGTGVRGSSESGHGVHGDTAGGVGVYGIYGGAETSGIGVCGESSTGRGVHGTSSSASQTTDGAGVHGHNSNGGTGVYGTSSGEPAGTGVRGDSHTGYAVHGTTNTGVGVYGHSIDSIGIGVHGENTAGGWAGYFEGPAGVTAKLCVSDTGSTEEPLEALHVKGKAYIDEMDSVTTEGDIVRWYQGRLCKTSSSARYKDDIQPLEESFDKILRAEPKSFTGKTSGKRGIGFIAEEFDALELKDLVVYKDGQPDGVKYELVGVYLLEVLKEQVQATKQLKAENELLEQRIEALEGVAAGHQLGAWKGVQK